MSRASLSIVVGLLAFALASRAEAQRRRWHPHPHPAASADAGVPATNAVDQNPFDQPASPPPTDGTTGSGGTTTPPAGTGQLAAQNPPPQGTPPSPATPNAAPTTSAPEDTGPPMPDLAPVRDEYTSVMDDLVQARARVATLGRTLFQTKVRVRLVNQATALYSLASAAIYLDGAPVYRGTGADLHEQATQVFDGFAAPGPHELVIEVEQRSRDGDAYRYTLRDTFRFQVTREHLSEVTLTLADGSGIAREFPANGEGQYDTRIIMRVATRALNTP